MGSPRGVRVGGARTPGDRRSSAPQAELGERPEVGNDARRLEYAPLGRRRSARYSAGVVPRADAADPVPHGSARSVPFSGTVGVR
jgi:hypothetical protein